MILGPLWYPDQTSSPAVTASHLSTGHRPFLFASASSPASWGLSSPTPSQTRQQKDSLPHLMVDKCLSCREGSGSHSALRCVLFRFAWLSPAYDSVTWCFCQFWKFFRKFSLPVSLLSYWNLTCSFVSLCCTLHVFFPDLSARSLIFFHLSSEAVKLSSSVLNCGYCALFLLF